MQRTKRRCNGSARSYRLHPPGEVDATPADPIRPGQLRDAGAHRRAVAALFYDKLFHADPTLRRLFGADLHAQGRRLMTMIGVAVAGLDRAETLVPALRALGARHAGYGVTDAHYATVGGALLETLRHGLGDAFTPALCDAWTAVYTLVGTTMRAGAREALAVA